LKLLNHIDDFLFALGGVFLSLGAYEIYRPAGIIVLGFSCVAFSCVIAKAAEDDKRKRGIE
jgi:hypothetical protein